MQPIERPDGHTDRRSEGASGCAGTAPRVIELLLIQQRIADDTVQLAACSRPDFELPSGHLQLSLPIGLHPLQERHFALGEQHVHKSMPQVPPDLPSQLGEVIPSLLFRKVSRRNARSAAHAEVQQPIGRHAPQPQRRSIVLVRVLAREPDSGIRQLARGLAGSGRHIHCCAPLRDDIAEVEHREKQVCAVPLCPRPAACGQRSIKSVTQSRVLERSAGEIRGDLLRRLRLRRVVCASRQNQGASHAQS